MPAAALPDTPRLTIGALAQRAQLGAETLRYYERLGLLAPQQRTASGYRLYDPSALDRLDFIRRAQALGFSLEQIGELLTLHARPEGDMGAVRAVAAQRLAEIDAKMVDLQRMKQGLQTLLDACPGHGPSAQCPILAALRGERTKEEAHEHN